jgi:hypothetical protein
MAWFLAYHHSIRSDEAGVKFLFGEAEAIAEGRRLGSLGYVITNVSLTTKARNGSLSDPEPVAISDSRRAEH